MNMVLNGVSSTLKHAYTMYLFTKSDVKTILVPVSVFGVVATTEVSPHRKIYMIFWVWIHLLQFCVSNQVSGIGEDAVNKPWRPLPASRITSEDAYRLRWILLPLCVGLSISQGVSRVGIILSLGIWINNDLGFDRHWFTRNLCSALGYWAFNHGATSILCAGNRCEIGRHVLVAEMFSSLIVLTTIQAQDFQDIEGDRVLEHHTLPILLPTVSRNAMLLLLIAWSISLGQMAQLQGLRYALFTFSGIAVGYRFVAYRTARQDHKSYVYYNVWLCVVQLLSLQIHL
ncbi:UbiA prenyltransferase family [Armillaria mellea]|nr:UbiA prenyltransferase family [Armillaria mellea]